ncbi:PREDICTED: uncharacterized protein LOC109359744 [Lupinus angustifolius]|uniref:uncharacterized protein LOC109359744 n=1 Tax=Lupinus angustifolius TaxID=3871 RepID=UPI00092EB0EC|nr:PREDICTED: uncharacterized protein LOC109359744 [Lupinus angustifolius]
MDSGREELRREREEQRIRNEVNEARMKRLEETLAQLTTRARVSNVRDEGSEFGEEHEVRNQRGKERWRKLDIPIFSGDDTFGWTHRLERYFSLKEVTEEEKMQATLMALEGKALSWYNWWSRCNPHPSWEGFKIAVVRRFQPSMVQNPFEQLLALRQTGTMEEYVEEFEKYVGALREIDPEFVKGIFLNGLKEEVKAEVKLYEHPNLTEVIHKALMVEEKNIIMQRKGSSNNYARSTRFTRSNFPSRSITLESKSGIERKSDQSSGGSASVNMNNAQTVDGSRGRGGAFKQLTGAELREKREKGLCFRCDEPFNRDHKCKNRQFIMILLEEEEDEEEEVDSEEIEGANLHSLQLSLRAMAGLTSNKSWKVTGCVKGKEVVILIDCGASHNFISTKVVEQLQLEAQATPRYVVEVGDGHKVQCQGRCAQLGFQLQGLDFTQEFYLFELEGVDVVLGLEWLAGLGEVRADFGKLELTLRRGEEVHTIRGDPALTKTRVSFGAFMQLLKGEGEGLWLHCSESESSLVNSSLVLEELEALLQQFVEVFANPEGLPP